MLIKNIIESARLGDSDSIKTIKEQYLYIADKFYNPHCYNISLERLYSLYDIIIDNYLQMDYPLSISAYIHNEFKAVLKHLFKVEKTSISDYLVMARNGNKEAREFLINHYSYIVLEKAKEYDYLEYDDLVQYGMIKLIEVLDNTLENTDRIWLVMGIIRSINYYFSITLKKEVLTQRYDYQQYDNLSKDALSLKISEIEFEDIVERCNKLNDKDKLVVIKHIIENNTMDNIGKVVGISKQAVKMRIDKSIGAIKHNYVK